MKTLVIPTHESATATYPVQHVVKKLIESGAPLKWKKEPSLFRDSSSSEVEFTGTIFRRELVDGSGTLYGWNTI